MNQKSLLVLLTSTVIMVLLGMIGRPVAAEPAACPCWNIEAVRQAVSAGEFSCHARAEVQALSRAIAQALNRAQNFHLEAYVIEVEEQNQAWCKCFSNPLIPGCAEGEIKGIELPEGQACINEISKLCEDTRKK
jgi:hypothetical protein